MFDFKEYKKYKLSELLTETNIKKTNENYDIISSTTKGIYLQSEYFNKQAASEDTKGYKIIKKSQLVLSPQNLWMGNININFKYDIGIVSPSYKVFDINENMVDLLLFNEWIKSPRALYQYIISSEQGASIVRRNLNMELFYEISIVLPSISIQKSISKKIHSFNNLIQFEEDRLIILKNLKKGLMQQMFV